MEQLLTNFHDKIKNDLKSFGYLGNDICDARLFVELKINDFWVDTPPKFRNELEKDYSKKSSILKKMKKEILSVAKNYNFKIVYNKKIEKYLVVSI